MKMMIMMDALCMMVDIMLAHFVVLERRKNPLSSNARGDPKKKKKCLLEQIEATNIFRIMKKYL